jgi:hypothetical protein
MNVLRFPIQLPTGKNQFMHDERKENETIPEENRNSIENETILVDEFLCLRSKYQR